MSNKPIKNYPGITPPVGYQLNPYSNNWVYCPEGKMINPTTGRCVSKNSRTISKTAVQKVMEAMIPSIAAPVVKSPTKAPIKNSEGLTKPAGYQLNPISGNWVSCPEHKVINPITGRCVDKNSKSLTKAKKPKSVLYKIIEEQMAALSKLGNVKRRQSIEASVQKQLKDMKRRYTA